MQLPKLLIFDWDGTLSDSSKVVIELIQKTADQLQLTKPNKEKIYPNLSLDIKKQITLLFPELPTIVAEKFLTYYNKKSTENFAQIPLFPYAKETLYSLQRKGHVFAIATNKYRNDLEKNIEKYQLATLFSTYRCSSDGHAKPHPEMLHSILKILQISNHEAIMIGDSEHDMQMAQNANIKSIAVTYGTCSKKQLMKYKPYKFLNKITDLLEINN